MVKTPRTRHSRSNRPPVTLDLTANADSPVEDDVKPADDQKYEAVAVETPAADDSQPFLNAEQADQSDSAPEHTPDPIEVPEQPDSFKFEEPATTETQTAETLFDKEPEKSEAATSSSQPYRSDASYASPPPPQQRSGMSALTAGLIGGVSALVLAGLLQFAGLLGAPGSGGTDNSALQAEVNALKSQISSLGQPGDGAQVQALGASIEQVKTDLAALQSAVQAGGGGDVAAVAALDAKLKEVEASIANLAQANPSGEAVNALTGKVSAVEQAVAALTAKVDAQAAQPKIALAISAAGLKSALDRGAPFSAELETFAAVAPSAPEVEALRPFADTGVMTRADIAKSFPEAANAMVAAATPADADAGFLDRLWSSAESVVKVRPIGEVAGEDPPARVARIEVAINAGNYDRALTEFVALPENVQAAGASLFDKIKARVEVEKLVDQMIAGAMKA